MHTYGHYLSVQSSIFNEDHSCGLGKRVPLYATHGPWTLDLMLMGHT
jgi:hypothetical protein